MVKNGGEVALVVGKALELGDDGGLFLEQRFDEGRGGGIGMIVENVEDL